MKGYSISVALADEHQLYRKALALTLTQSPNILVIGETGNGSAAEALYGSVKPDIMIIDITVNSSNGFTTTENILAVWPEARLVLLSTFFVAALSTRIKRLGARGYLTKSMSYQDIVEAIRKIYEGESYFIDQ